MVDRIDLDVLEAQVQEGYLPGTPVIVALIAELKQMREQVADVSQDDSYVWDEVEQVRVHYSYGVNSGSEVTLNKVGAVAHLIESIERQTMGRINVDKIEKRTKTVGVTPWVFTNREDVL